MDIHPSLKKKAVQEYLAKSDNHVLISTLCGVPIYGARAEGYCPCGCGLYKMPLSKQEVTK